MWSEGGGGGDAGGGTAEDGDVGGRGEGDRGQGGGEVEEEVVGVIRSGAVQRIVEGGGVEAGPGVGCVKGGWWGSGLRRWCGWVGLRGHRGRSGTGGGLRN